MAEFNTTKSGFEIRTDVMQMAQSQLMFEYNAKFALWETSCKKNADGTVSYITEMPAVPGVEQILDTAKKMYDFVTVKRM